MRKSLLLVIVKEERERIKLKAVSVRIVIKPAFNFVELIPLTDTATFQGHHPSISLLKVIVY